MPQYGDASYWDERYQREPTCFDWYQKYEGLEPIIHQHLKQEGRILHVGVGTSQLQLDMVQQGGYQQIVNTDISAVVVKHMQELHHNVPQLTYRVGDVRSMPEFKDDWFDGILDKGTLDAILCGKGAAYNAITMLQECCRVLRPNCSAIIVTYGEPASRLPLLLGPDLPWFVKVYLLAKADEVAMLGTMAQLSPIIHGPIDAHTVVPDSYHGLNNVHYVYVCTKHDGSGSSNSSVTAAGNSSATGAGSSSSGGSRQ